MRVLVDTSVWSLALRKGGPADDIAVRKLIAFLEANEEVFVTGIILQEVLQAFRGDTTFRKMVVALEPFPLLSLGRSAFVAAAAIHRTCANHGIAASTADSQIAAAAIQHGCALLSNDEDFARIARHTPLRLA